MVITMKRAALLEGSGDVLEQIGAHMVGVTQDGFRTQGRSQKWHPRRVPNIAGIVEDLMIGPRIERRRGQAKPALIDHSRLLKSIAYRSDGRKSVVIGTNVPYASVHQYGGVSTVRITDRVRDNLQKLLDKADPKNPDKILPAGVTWSALKPLFSMDTLRLRIKPRKFLEITQMDVRDIREIINDHVARVDR